MIYITGDIHGRPDILDEILKILKPGDILIVVGDFGVGFFDSYCSEEKFYDYIAKMQITLIFIDGNHEVFPKLNGYAVSEWNGGKVHKIRDNIIHCMRGEVYTIEGKTIFTFGGGYSMDRENRTEGFDWFPEENITEDQRLNAEKNLARVNYKVDYCISHTAPIETVERLAQKYAHIKKNVIEEFELTNFLQLIDDNPNLPLSTRWYFGHFHCDDDMLWDRSGRTLCALMHDVRAIDTGEVVYTRKRKSDSPDRIIYIRDEWN